MPTTEPVDWFIDDNAPVPEFGTFPPVRERPNPRPQLGGDVVNPWEETLRQLRVWDPDVYDLMRTGVESVAYGSIVLQRIFPHYEPYTSFYGVKVVEPGWAWQKYARKYPVSVWQLAVNLNSGMVTGNPEAILHYITRRVWIDEKWEHYESVAAEFRTRGFTVL